MSVVAALLAAGCVGGSGGGSGAGGGGGASGGGNADDGNGSGSGTGTGDGAGAFALPPTNAPVDYQLGGAYTLPGGVQIVSRDRNARLSQHPELILRDGAGKPVIDADWNEMLIDISTASKRTAVAAVVGEWIEGCANAGFDALEIDNLDTFTRSGGRLTEANAIVMMKMFSDIAHAHGLAVAQKNSAELAANKAQMGTDFVVAEECNRYGECGDYMSAYGNHVIVIEYRQADFDQGCKNFPELSIVLRDRNLVKPSQPGYVFAGC